MLEKVMGGVRLITKLRAILLMEADFNGMNKIIFGERMMEYNLRKYELVPEEIFSKKTGKQVMEACQRNFSGIYADSSNRQPDLLQWMQRIVMIK